MLHLPSCRTCPHAATVLERMLSSSFLAAPRLYSCHCVCSIDHSGEISHVELNKILRRKGRVPRWARFDAQEEERRQEELRKRKTEGIANKLHRSLVRKIAQSGGTTMSAEQEKLLHKLGKEREGLVNCFRAWDSNGDGYLSKREFFKALPRVGIVADKPTLHGTQTPVS